MRPNETPVGDLATAATIVASTVTCDAVERRFLDDPDLSAVVMTHRDGLATVSRSRFLTRYAGRLGHGRALYAQRPIADLAGDATALVLPAETDVLAAGRLALERPLGQRYDDLVVRGAPRPRIVHFATLLSAIAALYAERAVQDPLTGLANRRLVVDELQRRLDGDDPDVCLLFVDIDDFKAVNDSLGHPVGDALLVTIAHRLRDAFREDDVVARLGGDEFVVLLRVGDEQEARRAADRIRLSLAAPIDLTGDRDLPVRCSVGVVVRDAETEAEDLLRAADIAMYVAKRGGKGRSALYRPAMHEDALARLDLRQALPTAVARGEVHVAYQPVIDLGTGATTAVEALARWTHPQRGLIPPAVFIPLAEELDVLDEIGGHVLTTAVAQVARLDPALVVTVNVGVRELESGGLLQRVRDALDAASLPPGRLVLEITETTLTSDNATAANTLRDLSTAGVAIAIDDFGTGHSSLARLDRFTIDVLKLDKALVDPLAERDDRGLLEGLLGLARALGLEVVAEGVETPAQHRRLRELGCRLGQGHLFAKPLTPGRLEAWIGPVEAQSR